MNTFVITGCSGSLGRKLCSAVLAAGNRVIGIDIAAPKAQFTDECDFEFRKADVADHLDLNAAMAGADMAIHCAALLPHKDYLGLDAYIRTNAYGARNFILSCKENRIKKAVVISTTGVLKPNRGKTIFDSAEYRQTSNFYIKSKIEAEKLIDKLGLNKDLDYVILRPAAIYGIGMDYKWKEIFRMAENNRLFVVSSGRGLYSVICVDDFVDAILLAVQRLDKSISGEKITISSSDRVTIKDMLQQISIYFTAKPPKRVPFFAAYIGASLANIAGRLVKNDFLSSINPETIVDYNDGLFFDNTKASRLLGFESRRKFQVEIMNVMDNYMENK